MLADETNRMAVIHHDHGTIFLRQIADTAEIGDDAVHREHAIGGDQLEAAAFGLLQLLFQGRHVVVGIAEALCLGEPHAVDDRGMVERIRDNGILFRQQRLEQTAIGIEAGGIEDRRFHAQEGRNPRLELLVLFLRATDEANRGHAVAIAVERLLRGLGKLLVVGKTEIVVGAEIEDACAAEHGDLAGLLGGDDTLRLEEAGFFQAGEFVTQV